MSIIYVNHKSHKKQNKKPGWKREQEEYQEWLKRINSMTCFSVKPKVKNQRQEAVVKLTIAGAPPGRESLTVKVEPRPFVAGSCGKPINDPRILYKDNPELLLRELKAREKRFMVAPVYNKGGDMLITDEMMKDISSGATRRRN